MIDAKTTLKSELALLPQSTREHIRELAYRVADATKPLALLLESADCHTGHKAGPLLEEHMLFCEILSLLEKSELTKLL